MACSPSNRYFSSIYHTSRRQRKSAPVIDPSLVSVLSEKPIKSRYALCAIRLPAPVNGAGAMKKRKSLLDSAARGAKTQGCTRWGGKSVEDQTCGNF
jgi:hypothetical protein